MFCSLSCSRDFLLQSLLIRLIYFYCEFRFEKIHLENKIEETFRFMYKRFYYRRLWLIGDWNYPTLKVEGNVLGKICWELQRRLPVILTAGCCRLLGLYPNSNSLGRWILDPAELLMKKMWSHQDHQRQTVGDFSCSPLLPSIVLMWLQ